jgi:hypothetical protein
MHLQYSGSSRLEMVLTLRPGIDCIYNTIFSTLPYQHRTRTVTGTVILLFGRLPLFQVANLLLIRVQDTQDITLIHDSFSLPIRTYHATLRDYPTDEKRSAVHFINPKEHHGCITQSCMQLMARELKRDMVAVEALSCRDSSDASGRRPRREFFSCALQYASHYWLSFL